MRILNIIVFYDNREEVEQYVTEVATISDDMVDIALIINSDKNDQAEAMEAALMEKGITSFSIFDYGENIGYLNAMLKTIRQVDIEAYDYVILSNTDIHYDTKDFFQRLVKMQYPVDVGCIAPSVYATQNKSYSNPHYVERIPKEKIERLVNIFGHPVLGKLYLKLSGMKASRNRTEKKPSCYVYSPHGCYMVFTKEFIKRIIGYEYGVKMYSEESAVGELLLRNNMKCFYDASISIVHQESSVTGKMNFKARFTAWRESLEYILKEFYDGDRV